MSGGTLIFIKTDRNTVLTRGHTLSLWELHGQAKAQMQNAKYQHQNEKKELKVVSFFKKTKYPATTIVPSNIERKKKDKQDIGMTMLPKFGTLKD